MRFLMSLSLSALLMLAAVFPLLAQEQGQESTSPEADPEEVVAEMDGYRLTQSEVDQLVASLGPRARQQLQGEKQRRQFIRKWMEVKAIAREAEESGLDEDETFQRQMELRRTQALADYYRAKVSQAASVSEEDMQAYYEQNKEYFRHPRMVRLNSIMVGSEEEARSIVEQLRNGGDFEKIAQVRSKDIRTRDRGGFMGWIQPGQLEAAMEQVAFGLEEGEISEPLRTVQGWHILMVDGTREPGYLTIDDIRDNLAQQLLQLKQKEEADELARRASEKYNVKLHFELEKEEEESPPGEQQ
ncbi:MAG TPA: peptidylprolyl isomerase [Acidobacteriota bacterium]|nr:peptidylprolyl isomerase [Acidobacteriota bacterium]